MSNATPDLSSYRNIHRALRLAPHRLARAARDLEAGDRRRTAAVARYWKGYAGEVLIHHTTEDDVFFPALIGKVDRAAALIARTDDEHHRLDEAMEAVDRAVRLVAQGSDARSVVLADHLESLATLMDDHLDFEDAEILPLFERHFSREQYETMEQLAIKAIGLGAQAAFTIPFAVAATPEPERVALLAEAPPAVRILHRVTRGRHARLEARAFGTSSPSPAVAA